MKLAGIKHKSFEAYLVKLKENLSCGFKNMNIFIKSRIFLKHEHFLENFDSIKK